VCKPFRSFRGGVPATSAAMTLKSTDWKPGFVALALGPDLPRLKRKSRRSARTASAPRA
jgi:hypothetical protein